MASAGRLVSTASGTGWATVRVAETLGERRALAREIEIFKRAPAGGGASSPGAGDPVVRHRPRLPPAPVAGAAHARRARRTCRPSTCRCRRRRCSCRGALNDFMGRLALARERLEALVAEAAHEVRTPLASLRLQAEVARGESDPDALRAQVTRIHDEAVQASQLVSQLLMDATISHRLDTTPGARRRSARGDRGRAPARSRHRRPRARIDRARHGGGLAWADRVVLREMLRNLVDNALTYSRGPVEIAVAARADGSIGIDVADRGPGIAIGRARGGVPALPARRGPAGTNGSGLGLAIVRRAVEAQRGRGSISRTGRAAGCSSGSCCRGSTSAPGAPGRESPRPRWRSSRSCGGRSRRPAPPRSSTPRRTARRDALGDPRRHRQRPSSPISCAASRRAGPTSPSPTRRARRSPSRGLRLRSRPPPDVMRARPPIFRSSSSTMASRSPSTLRAPPSLPGWAQWRSELFGFSFEPAVIVYNPDILAENEVPRSHLELAELLENRPCGSPARSRPTTSRARASATCWRHRTSRCRPTSGASPAPSAGGRAPVGREPRDPRRRRARRSRARLQRPRLLRLRAPGGGRAHRHRGARRLRPRRHPLDVRAGRGAARRPRRGLHRVSRCRTRASRSSPVPPRSAPWCRERKEAGRPSASPRAGGAPCSRCRSAPPFSSGSTASVVPGSGHVDGDRCTAIRQAGFVTGF